MKILFTIPFLLLISLSLAVRRLSQAALSTAGTAELAMC